MSGFVVLTKENGQKLYVKPERINAITISSAGNNKTLIDVGLTHWHVMESLEEILKLINGQA